MSMQFQFTQSPTSHSNSISGVNADCRPPIFVQFESIVRSDYRWFYGFALRIAKNHHDAEDAVQGAFLAAYQHLGELNSSQKLRPWIASIVLNCARMQYRVKNRFAFSLDEEMNDENDTRFLDVLRDPSTSPEDRYADLELNTRLNKVVTVLPAKLRQTFILRRIQGLDTAETAEALGVSERIVRGRLSRASAHLKKLLSGHIAGTRQRTPHGALAHQSRKRPSVRSTRQLLRVAPEQVNEEIHFLPPAISHETSSMEHP